MKVHVFAPNIVIDITYNGFEAGQMSVDRDRTTFAGPKTQILQIFLCVFDHDQSRSNYFAQGGQRALIHKII